MASDCLLSQPVRSPLCDFRVCENRRDSRGLGWRARVSGRQIPDFRVRTGSFAAPVSARHFPISVSACPRPVRYVTETGLRSRFRACTAAKVERSKIQEVVNTFAAVLDCAVVGTAHQHLGVVPVLFVVPRPGIALDNEALLAHCRIHFIGVQGAAQRSINFRDPSHRVGQDHTLQASRIDKG